MATFTKRNAAQRERDYAAIADLLNRFPYDTHARLHERFLAALPPARHAITRQQFSLDVKTLIERWRKDSPSIESWHARITQQILYAQQEFMDAWEKSKGQRQISTTRMVRNGAGDEAKPGQSVAEVRSEQSWGDPNYLLGYLRCCDRLTKLFALEPPVRRQIDLRLIREEVEAVAHELNLQPDELMHQVQSIVRERWAQTEVGAQPIATALELDTELDAGLGDDDDDV